MKEFLVQIKNSNLLKSSLIQTHRRAQEKTQLKTQYKPITTSPIEEVYHTYPDGRTC